MKKSTPYQPMYGLAFAMEVVSTAPNGDVTCRCKFCLYEGRDVVEVGVSGRKRKQRSDIKYFTKPFFPHKYRSHHEGQHAASWELYQTLSVDDKKTFFDDKIKISNSLHHHMDLTTDTLEFFISAGIVETIVGDLFFRDDEQLEDSNGDDSDDDVDVAGATARKIVKQAKKKINAMKLFVQQEDKTQTYTVTIKNVMRFELAMDHVSIGMSFRQTAAAIQHAEDHTKTAKLTGMNDLIVGQYTRVLVAVALQQIANLLDDDSVWAMSLAGDGSTHRGQSFFDLRMRVCFHGILVNLHLVAIPMFDRHAALNIFTVISKFLDALYGSWRAKLIGMSSDGENTMTGRHAGVVTRIVACAENKVLRIWCAPHQIDIVVKASAESICDGSWVKFANTFSVFLRGQDNLIVSMNVKCPKKTDRWVHLGRLLTFYKLYRRKLIDYTKEKRPEMLPSDEWWVITFSVSPAIDSINITFVLLQSRSLLIAQQEEHIHALVGSLTSLFSIEIEQPDNAEAGDVEYVSFSSMRVQVDDIVAHIEDQGSFARACYERLDADAKKAVVQEIATYAMTLVAGLNGVKAERNGANQSLDQDAPPVLPGQLIKLRHGTFLRYVLDPYREHIAKFWNPDSIDAIEADHRALLKAYNTDNVLRATIDTHTIKTNFNEAWGCTPGRFHRLRCFCGGLATVFANTTSVESDFSILKWEMDDNRTSIMHLSLEGIFQAKQRAMLQSLTL